MKKCPNCGSRELQIDDTAGFDLHIVTCLECDGVFEVRGKSGKNAKPFREEPDEFDDENVDDVLDEEVEGEDAGDLEEDR